MDHRNSPGGRYSLRRAGLALSAVMALGVGSLATPAFAADQPNASPSGRVDPRTLPSDQRPAPAPPSVVAKATPKGVEVIWRQVSPDAKAFDVSRTAGGVTDKLTDKPVRGRSFIDHTAKPGVRYTYSVTVADVATPQNAKTDASPFAAVSTGQVLGNATVTAVDPAAKAKTLQATPKVVAAHDGPPARTPTNRTGVHGDAVAQPQVAPTDLDPTCVVSGQITDTQTWSADSCPDGYLITDDLTITPSGSLTILPSTSVYFQAGTDSATDSETNPAGTQANPTDHVDLIVEGTLLAGQADAELPVTFESSNEGTATAPASGDWGDIYYDGTGATAPAGSLQGVALKDGTALVANEFALPLSSADVSDMAGDADGFGVDYQHVPNGATVSINRLTYDGTATNTGVGITAHDDSETYVPGSFTASVTDSDISGVSPLYIESDPVAGDGVLTLDVEGNTLSDAGDGTDALFAGIYTGTAVVADAVGGAPESARVTGTVAGNTVSSTSGGGIYLEADSRDSDAVAGASNGTCSTGAFGSCNDVHLAQNTVTSDRSALTLYSWTDNGTGDAVVAATVGDSSTDGGSYVSTGTTAWHAGVDAESEASDGNQYTVPSFNNATFRAAFDPESGQSGYSGYTAAYGDGGALTVSSPVLSNVTAGNDGELLSEYGWYNEADDSGDGNVVASPAISDSQLIGGDVGAYNRAYAENGAATASPGVARSTVQSAGNFTSTEPDGFYNEVEADGVGSTATGSPVVTGSTLSGATSSSGTGFWNDITSYYGDAVGNPKVTGSKILGDYGFYNEVYGGFSQEAPAEGDPALASGSAVASPVVTATSVAGTSDTAFYNYAESEFFSATAQPTIQGGSTVNAPEDYGVENEAYAADRGGQGPGLANPTIVGSTVQAGVYEALYNSANASNGDSLADGSFTVRGSTITATDDDGIYSESYPSGTGTTTVNPVIEQSQVSGDYSGVDLYTYTDDGSASIGGDVQDSAISASEDQAWYLYIEDSYGGVSITTSFSNSALHADDDDAIYIYVDNDQNQNLQAGSFSVAPTISGGTLYAGYGDGLYIDAYGNADTSDLSVAPSLDGVSINAYYDGIYINVDDDAYYDANEDSVFWPGKVHLGGHVNDSVINALDEYGVELDAYCDSGGYCRDGALNDFSAHNTAIYSYDDAWYSYTDSYAGQAASAPQLTSDNSSLWKSAYGSGVDVETDGYGESGQQDDMAVKGLLITAYDYGVSIEDSASYGASAVNNAVVDGNTITTTNDDGVYDDTGVESGGTATRNGAISNNVIHGTSSSGDGIEHYLGAPQPESEIDNLAITGNTIVGVGGDGIYVYTQGNEPTDGSSKITISGNTVRSTGNSGIAAYSVIADITGNQQSLSNLGGSETMPTVIGESQNAGIVVADAPIPGQLSCNMIVGNDTGVLYSGNAAGDPVTHQNSFQDDNGVTNRPVNLATDNASDAPTDATQNYWGMTTEDAIQSTVEGNVTVTPFLTSPAPCSLQASNPPPVQGGGGGGGTPPPTSLTVKSSDQPLGPNNPFIVTVTDPNGGPITFGAGNPPALPPGVDELKNFSFDIAAPASTASNPLTLVFEFDPSASPNGMPIVILRDGVPVTQSCASPTVASPDPCLKSYSVSDTGAVTITILSSHASNWTATLPQSGSIALACSSAGANPFTDVPASDVHKDAIACLNSFGITKGTTATTYSPSATVTRGQMAAFIARLLTDAGVSLGTGATGPFTDVSAASTFAQAINQLAAKGVVKGVTPTQYSPGTPVSRGQMAAFLVRAYELASGHTLPVATAPFTDISGSTFTTEIGKVWEVGITQGLTATQYAPEAPVQRDQMASFIARTLNLLFAQGLVA